MLNLTQHKATHDQISGGVVDYSGPENLERILTFETQPSCGEILSRARKLADIAESQGAKEVMIGGAMWLQGPLEKELCSRGIKPFYAYSERCSEETKLPSGEVKKSTVFKHLGFVKSCECEW